MIADAGPWTWSVSPASSSRCPHCLREPIALADGTPWCCPARYGDRLRAEEQRAVVLLESRGYRVAPPDLAKDGTPSCES